MGVNPRSSGTRSAALEIEENVPFQRRTWLVQRIGWLGMAAVLLLAAIGVLGPSRLTQTRVRQPGAEVVYYRVGRVNSPQEVRVQLSSTGALSRLRVDRQLASALNIERIEPRPAQESGDDSALFLTFVGTSDLEIIFHCRPARLGTIRGTVRVGDGPAFSLDQLVLP